MAAVATARGSARARLDAARARRTAAEAQAGAWDQWQADQRAARGFPEEAARDAAALEDLDRARTVARMAPALRGWRVATDSLVRARADEVELRAGLDREWVDGYDRAALDRASGAVVLAARVAADAEELERADRTHDELVRRSADLDTAEAALAQREQVVAGSAAVLTDLDDRRGAARVELAGAADLAAGRADAEVRVARPRAGPGGGDPSGRGPGRGGAPGGGAHRCPGRRGRRRRTGHRAPDRVAGGPGRTVGGPPGGRRTVPHLRIRRPPRPGAAGGRRTHRRGARGGGGRTPGAGGRLARAAGRTGGGPCRRRRLGDRGGRRHRRPARAARHGAGRSCAAVTAAADATRLQRALDALERERADHVEATTRETQALLVDQADLRAGRLQWSREPTGSSPPTAPWPPPLPGPGPVGPWPAPCRGLPPRWPPSRRPGARSTRGSGY